MKPQKTDYNNQSKSFRFKNNKSTKQNNNKTKSNNRKNNVKNKSQVPKSQKISFPKLLLPISDYCYYPYTDYNYYQNDYYNHPYPYYPSYTNQPPIHSNPHPNPSQSNNIVLNDKPEVVDSNERAETDSAKTPVNTKLSNEFKNQTPEDNIPFSIESSDDLIKICNQYDILKKENKKYNIDIDLIKSMEESLIKLDKMIGIEDIKQNVFDIMTYYLQD